MKKVGVIGKVEVFEGPDVLDDELYMISRVRPNMRKDGKLPFVKMVFDKSPFSMFYKKPKWYQWRLRRKYRRILETK